MGDYLLVCREPDDPAARPVSLDLAALAEKHGFRIAFLNPNAWLAVRGPTPPPHRRIGGWILVGDVMDRRSPAFAPSRPDDPWDYERKMIARFWGRFVGVRLTSDGRALALMRDPSGALECVAWRQGGLTLASSSAEPWLIRCLRPDWRLDTARIHENLHSLVGGTGRLMIKGPTALAPGTVQPLPLTEPSESLWRPVDFAHQGLEHPPSPEAAASRLVETVDEAVSGLAGLPGPLAAEVSGGLDSSIVASSLQQSGCDPVRLWLNAYGSTNESDERAYARLLGRALGFKPQCVRHVTAPLSAEWMTTISGGFRPGLNAIDLPQDVAWRGHMETAGAAAVMTGKGGDSILFQAATPDVFTDDWIARRWSALRAHDLTELAAANEVSIWTMICEAWKHQPAPPWPPQRDHPILAPLPGQAPHHPWLAGCEALGPGKTFQIAGVIDSVSHHGPTALTCAVDVRNPLCSQPVTEACLALPTPLLTFGGRDRGLAREAFRARLPSQIIDRRSKGEMTRIYARMVVDNLAFLRPWLINGRLAALGVIDRAAAQTELTPEALMWRGHYAVILTAAAYEGWVRTWEARLGPAS